MKRLIILIFILSFNIFPLDLDGVRSIKHWELLQEHGVKVEWSNHHEYPISKAEVTLDHNIKDIALIIENLENYPKIFKRVTETHRLGEDIVQIVLDLPFPFAGRDYVIQYVKHTLEDNLWVFSFSSINHPKEIKKAGHVRLPNASGIWILNPLSPNRTKVTYAWNGELLGNFPDIGLTRAWITQGTEVLTWLNESMSSKAQ